jgi:hypothetical protein
MRSPRSIMLAVTTALPYWRLLVPLKRRQPPRTPRGPRAFRWPTSTRLSLAPGQPAGLGRVKVPWRTCTDRAGPGEGRRPDDLSDPGKVPSNSTMPLIKVDGSSAAQLAVEPGEGHYPDFDYPELGPPVTKLLRATIGQGA